MQGVGRRDRESGSPEAGEQERERMPADILSRVTTEPWA